MIYTVTFNPALDYVLHTGSLIQGEVNRTSREELYCGGKGINVSVILRRLGVDSTALGFIAGFTGKELEKRLHQLGIKTDFILLPCGMTRINVKLKAGQETDINAAGPEIPPESAAELTERIEQLRKGDILCLSGSVPQSMPADSYEQILAGIDGKGIQCVVDASGELLTRVLKYRPFLVKPNHFELGEIFGRRLTETGEIAECAARLQKSGARNVLVSMAAEGAMLLDENGKFYKINAPSGRAKNSVGAGDSMVAGFLAGFFETHDYAQALRLGTAAGSATAFSDDLASGELIRRTAENIQKFNPGEML